MNSLKDTALESNPYLRINFDGGDLSSDAGKPRGRGYRVIPMIRYSQNELNSGNLTADSPSIVLGSVNK